MCSMNYFALPGKVVKIWIFTLVCLLSFMTYCWKKFSNVSKNFLENYTGLSVIMKKLFWQEKRNSNVHNFFLEVQNNLFKFLNLRHLYLFQIGFFNHPPLVCFVKCLAWFYSLNLFGTQFLDFRNWWPGWNGEKAGNPAFNFDSEDFLGISMKRKFDFVKTRQNTQVTVERFIDYYFWGLQDLQSKLPFLCEKPKKDIGCVEGLLYFNF